MKTAHTLEVDMERVYPEYWLTRITSVKIDGVEIHVPANPVVRVTKDAGNGAAVVDLSIIVDKIIVNEFEEYKIGE